MARNILMVGTIFHAQEEFASLSKLATVKVRLAPEALQQLERLWLIVLF
jgi:hypothetical protein